MGQKDHDGYLPHTPSLDDLEEEIINAWFYQQAIKERQGHHKGAKIARIHVNQLQLCDQTSKWTPTSLFWPLRPEGRL